MAIHVLWHVFAFRSIFTIGCILVRSILFGHILAIRCIVVLSGVSSIGSIPILTIFRRVLSLWFIFTFCGKLALSIIFWSIVAWCIFALGIFAFDVFALSIFALCVFTLGILAFLTVVIWGILALLRLDLRGILNFTGVMLWSIRTITVALRVSHCEVSLIAVPAVILGALSEIFWLVPFSIVIWYEVAIMFTLFHDLRVRQRCNIWSDDTVVGEGANFLLFWLRWLLRYLVFAGNELGEASLESTPNAIEGRALK